MITLGKRIEGRNRNAENKGDFFNNGVEAYESISKIEEQVLTLKNFIRKTILGAALALSITASMSGNNTEKPYRHNRVIQEQGVNKGDNAHNHPEIITPETYAEQQKEHAKALMKERFLNPEDIIRKSGGVVQVEVAHKTNEEEKNIPLIIHIGQNHGEISSSTIHPDTLFSQHLVRDSIIACIENNLSKEPLIVALEGNEGEGECSPDRRVGALRTVISSNIYSAVYQQKARTPDDGKRIAGGEHFPHPPKNITQTHALIGIIQWYEPSECEAILSHINRNTFDYNTINKIINADVSQQMTELLLRIEQEHNVHFEPVVPWPTKLKSAEGHTARSTIEEIRELVRSSGSLRAVLNNPDALKKCLTLIKHDFDLVFTQREEYSFQYLLDMLQDTGSTVGAIVYGSAHDFYDNAQKQGAVNLMRIETAPGIAYEGAVDYSDVVSSFGERWSQDYNYNIDPRNFPSRDKREIESKKFLENFLASFDAKEPLEYLVSVKEYAFILERFSVLKEVLNLNEDDLLFVVDKMIDDGYTFYLERYANTLREFLSTQRYNAVQEHVKGLIARR